LAGVIAKLALSSATTMSQLTTVSTAPPHTEPWTCAITGNGACRSAAMAASSALPCANGSVPSSGNSPMS